MFTRLFISASVAALLCAAPAVAQETTTEQPIIKQKSGDTDAAGQGQTQPQTNEQVNQDQSGAGATDQTQQNAETTTKKKAGSGDTTGDPAGDAEQTGQNAETTTKKKAGQTTDSGEAATEEGGTQKADQTDKTKKDANAANNDSSGKAAKMTTEKKTVIREKIVTKSVTRVNRSDINFNLSIGVAIPATIVVNPLPIEVVEVYPEYQGYLFFVLDDGTIVIVEPGSLQIVTVIA